LAPSRTIRGSESAEPKPRKETPNQSRDTEDRKSPAVTFSPFETAGHSVSTAAIYTTLHHFQQPKENQTMCTDDHESCRRIQTALKLFLHRDGPKLDRDLFRHSLPTPTPTEKQDILDIILQIIAMLLEEFKHEPCPPPGPDETDFPNLVKQSETFARQHVSPALLPETARSLSNTITETIKDFQAYPPTSLRVARETIRTVNHAALANAAPAWARWNDTIRDILDNHAADGQLATLPSYLDAWAQIAKGLSRIQ